MCISLLFILKYCIQYFKTMILPVHINTLPEGISQK